MKKIKVFQTNLFAKKLKKLSKKQKKDLENPQIGEEKKGELIGVYVYKFKSSHQKLLLAYEWDEKTKTLLVISFRENFYRDLKKSKS